VREEYQRKRKGNNKKISKAVLEEESERIFTPPLILYGIN